MTPRGVFLVVWWFDRFGGMERHVADLAIALADAGIAVTVFSECPAPRSNQYARRLAQAGISLIAPSAVAHLAARPGWPLANWRQRWRERHPRGDRQRGSRREGDAQHAASARAMLAAIERCAITQRPEVIHVHGCRLGQSGIVAWSRDQGYATVYTEHLTIGDWDGPFDQSAPACIGEDADVILCVSEHSRRSLATWLPERPDIAVTRHIVADPGIDTDPPPGMSDNPPQVVAVGRLSMHKGYDTLLRATAMLRDAGRMIDLRIAGSGRERAKLQALRSSLRLDDRVHLLGQRDEAGVSALWRQAAFGVLASTTEALPLTIVEAMAHGRAVVATRVGGVPEVVVDAETGLLVDPGDAAALTAAMRRLIDDPALAGRLGSGARAAYMAGGWSPAAVTARTIAWYQQAIDAREKRTPPDGRAERTDAVQPARPGMALFIWGLASFGDMEALLARQAIALATTGAEVAVYTERPVGRANRYRRAMQAAGVRVITPSRIASLRAIRSGASLMVRAFAEDCRRQPPAALYAHGWRLDCGGGSLRELRQIADDHGIPLGYCEHATSDDGPPPAASRIADATRADLLSAASPAAARYLAAALASARTIAILRHAPRPAPPAQIIRPPADAFRVFAPSSDEMLADIPGMEFVATLADDGQLALDRIAGCDAVVLSRTMSLFDAALGEAMGGSTPVIICGEARGTAIRDRANGLVATVDAMAPLRELAGDPLLARQLARAARRTYDIAGMHDRAIASELELLFAAPRDARMQGCGA